MKTPREEAFLVRKPHNSNAPHTLISKAKATTTPLKMIFFLKSLSRSVHDQEHHHEPVAEAEVETRINDGKCTSLTVWRKSLLISCNGFTVINSCGGLVYRVDNYIDRPEELILMDGSGKSILTIRRRKKLGVPVHSWFIYEGEVGNYCATNKLSKKPIWCVRKNINILQTNHNVLAYVFRGSTDKRHSFVIEGSYTHRSCKVLGGSREVLAEITRKEAIVEGVSYGVEVFVLNVEPGFDPGFAMGLLLILDQMFP
ncbi:hypothetical protein DKX38_004606 [Salix brachista]|uniref:Protein LURP-one-related 17 n=1 Tax=Salix brachista TaxID=2182728 RepID=A0A5N5NBN7_9ROSI|nr:hypothetical protein DKX38_004606 [Salix brachista]